MAYYMLLVRDDASAQWHIEFGDFDRETVEFERDDYIDHDHKRSNLKIVVSPTAKRWDCEAVVSRINAGAYPASPRNRLP